MNNINNGSITRIINSRSVEALERIKNALTFFCNKFAIQTKALTKVPTFVSSLIHPAETFMCTPNIYSNIVTFKLLEIIYNIMKNQFDSLGCIISRLEFSQSANYFKIRICYFIPGSSNGINLDIIQQIAYSLTKIAILVKLDVKLELIYINIADSAIMIGKTIHGMSEYQFKSFKRTTTNIIKRNRIFNTNYMDKYSKSFYDKNIDGLTGIKIIVSGRLSKDPIIPRKTTSFMSSGSTSKATYLEQDHLVYKNRRGTFCIKTIFNHVNSII